MTISSAANAAMITATSRDGARGHPPFALLHAAKLSESEEARSATHTSKAPATLRLTWRVVPVLNASRICTWMGAGGREGASLASGDCAIH